jgi:hypothetical protein
MMFKIMQAYCGFITYFYQFQINKPCFQMKKLCLSNNNLNSGTLVSDAHNFIMTFYNIFSQAQLFFILFSIIVK